MNRIMRCAAVFALAAGAWAGPGRAEPFSLKDDATGRVYGPFEATNGARVVLGTNTFTLVKSTEKRVTLMFEPTTEQKLANTIIPQVDFRDASVKDVIEFLRQASEEHSPYKNARQKGVNLVTKLGEADEAALISFRASRISLGDTLKAVLSVANLEYEMRTNWILIKPRPRKTK